MGVSTYQTKEGRLYKAILYMDGEAVASKRGFKTKREARNWMMEEERLRQSPSNPPSQGTSFSDLSALYLSDMEGRRQHNTYRYKTAAVSRLIGYVGGDFFIEDLTSQEIDSYLHTQLQERGSKAANRDLLELKAVLNWAIRKDMYPSNPFRRVEPYPEEKYVRYVPQAEDVAKVRAVAEGQERDFVDVLYYTGARLSEACDLQWSDVNFAHRTITLWTRKRRGGGREARTMAMVMALHDALLARAASPCRHETHVFTNPESGLPLTKNTVWTIHLMTRLCERAGVQRFTAHCIRHFVATRLKDSRQATPFQIQNFLGHQNLSTTEKYLHELEVDRGIAAILEDDGEANLNRIEPQIEPQAADRKNKAVTR